MIKQAFWKASHLSPEYTDVFLWKLSQLLIIRSTCYDEIFKVTGSKIKVAENVFQTRSLNLGKRPCDCCVGQFWPRYNWKNIVCTEPHRSISSHCDEIGLPIYRKGEITQNKGYTGFGVVTVWLIYKSKQYVNFQDKLSFIYKLNIKFIVQNPAT